MAPPHAQGHEAIRPGPDRWCYFENAPEMLDQPGEWYLDRSTGELRYWPLADENLATAEVVAPVLQRLVEVKGTPEHPVRNLHFLGLRFVHSGLTLPDGGYLGIQACHCTTGKTWTEKWGRVPAAIRWDYVEKSTLENGELAHLGGCGVELVTACHDNLIQGNHKDRMDCTGMHWRLPGARAMLKTRAIYLNSEWDDFIEYRIQREQAILYQTAA